MCRINHPHPFEHKQHGVGGVRLKLATAVNPHSTEFTQKRKGCHIRGVRKATPTRREARAERFTYAKALDVTS
ncbi:MAG: hypothetical protein ACREBR_04280 [bacterium]